MCKEVNVEKIISTIDAKLAEVRSNEDFQKYLRIIARQYRHSPNNLIIAQMQLEKIKGKLAEVSLLKGKKQWEDQGVEILPNEKPLKILAPIKSKYLDNDSEHIDYNSLSNKIAITGVITKYAYGKYTISVINVNNEKRSGSILVQGNGLLSYNMGSKVLGIKGTVKKYKNITYLSAEEVINTNLEFKLKTSSKIKFQYVEVYDFSQTSGKKLVCKEIKGSTQLYEILFNYFTDCGYKIGEEDISANGAFVPSSKKIFIKKSLDEKHKLKTLLHELAHYKVNEKKLNKDGSYSWEECIVESVAYILTNNLGIDTSEYSFDYIALWQLSAGDSIRNNLKIISKLTNELMSEIDKALVDYDELRKVN